MNVNKKIFIRNVKEDADKRKIKITDEQIESLIPELEDMFELQDHFMSPKHPRQILLAGFIAGVMHALGGFNNSKVDLLVTEESKGNFSVDYLRKEE